MYFKDSIRSVEMVEEQVEIITEQGVSIFGGGSFRFLTPAQRDLINNLTAWDIDELVFDLNNL